MSLLTLYQTATGVGRPAIDWYLQRRVQRGKEDPERLDERRGRASLKRPEGVVAWVHSASVGESLSILPLLDAMALRWPSLSILVTTGTMTSARLMEERLSHERMFHQFVPVDVPDYVDHFLGHWRPNVALWVESEFWPNLMLRTAALGTPMILVNARLSDRSFNGWQRARGSIRQLLRQFRVCLAQDKLTADRLRVFGSSNVQVTGNLKSVAAPLPYQAEVLEKLKKQITGRDCWIAASTHPGEEELIAEAHLLIRMRRVNALTILAPRHPERGQEIATTLRSKGLEVSLRSASEDIENKTEIYIADTLGELGIFYRLAPIAFLGGSLVAHGGQNALEAIRLGCAIVHGRHTHNFTELYHRLKSLQAGLEVATPVELAEAITDLLQEPARLSAQLTRAEKVIEGDTDILRKIVDQIAPYVPPTAMNQDNAHHARA